MMEHTNKITALYSCLSVGDEDRDSGKNNSIVNQRAFLGKYARKKRAMNKLYGDSVLGNIEPKCYEQLSRKNITA